MGGQRAGEEARIGQRAATLVDETSTVAIDAGQLGYEVARALPEHFRGTVVTHSIPVIQLLMSGPRPPRVVGLGGELLPGSFAFGGASTVAAIDSVRVDTLFLAIDGLDDRGAYARSDGEAARALSQAGLDVLVTGDIGDPAATTNGAMPAPLPITSNGYSTAEAAS